METSELQHHLNRLGFDAGQVDGQFGPQTATATARFQLACALPGHNLVVDATPGPRTWAALDATGPGRLSPHFNVSELRTRTRAGGPKDGTCWVHRDLLHALESLRGRVGRPLPIVSGWRDVAHNRRVGGASRSQHTFGAATELEAIRGRLARRALLNAGRAADFNR
jgi:zinc D-Ala-D-Ala carboxypeptidase